MKCSLVRICVELRSGWSDQCPDLLLHKRNSERAPPNSKHPVGLLEMSADTQFCICNHPSGRSTLSTVTAPDISLRMLQPFMAFGG